MPIAITADGVLDAGGIPVLAPDHGVDAQAGVGIRVTGAVDATGIPVLTMNRASTPDTIAPSVASVAVTSVRTIDVAFTDQMDPDTTTDPGNYVLSGDGQGTLAANPGAVELAGSGVVRLRWDSGDMADGGDVTVTATGVKDASLNLIGEANVQTQNAGGLGVPPSVFSLVQQPSQTYPMLMALVYGKCGLLGDLHEYQTGHVVQVSGSELKLGFLSGESGSIDLTGFTKEMYPTISLWYEDPSTHGALTGTWNVTDIRHDAASASWVVACDVTGHPLPAITFPNEYWDYRLVPSDDWTMMAPITSLKKATTPASYTISGLGAGTLPLNPAGVRLNMGSYYLYWESGTPVPGQAILLTISADVRDTAENSVVSGNTQFMVRNYGAIRIPGRYANFGDWRSRGNWNHWSGM